MNAGDSRSNQQLREAALARGRAQRHAIQQNLRAGRSEQHAASSAFIQRAAQFLPRGFKLRRRAHVAELIQACEFQQNIQAAYERPCRSSCISSHRLRKLQSLPRALSDVLLQYGDPVEETSLVSRIVPISVTFSRRICSLAPSVSKTSSLNPPEAAGVAPSLRRLYNTVPRSPGALPRFLRRFVVPRGVNQTDIQECRTSPPPNASRRTSVRFLVVPRRPPTRSPVSSRCASLAFSPRLYSASFVCAG